MTSGGYLNEDHIYHCYMQITQSTGPTDSQFFVGKYSIHINFWSSEGICNLSKCHEDNATYEQYKMSHTTA